MSTLSLELLYDLELISRSGVVPDLAVFSDIELQNKLSTYSNHRIQSINNELESVKSDASMFSALISSVSATNAIQPLLPSTLVYDRVYTNDPVFMFGLPQHDYTKSASKLLGFSNGFSVERDRIKNSLNYYAMLAPLIRTGAVCSLPISYLHKPPSQLPIYFSEDGFNSQVPEHIRSYVYENAKLQEVMIDRDTGKMMILHDAPNSPTRMISISFGGDHPSGHSMLHFLSQMRKVGEAEGSMIRIEQTFDPDDIPNEAMYKAWVQQSINRTILARLKEVSSELNLAQTVCAAYMTESAFEAKSFSLSSDKALPATSREMAVNFLRAATPFLSVESPELVAKIRNENELLFKKFHASMLQIASQLTGIDGDFEDKAQQLYMKEVEPHVQAINVQLGKARSQVGVGIITAASATVIALLKSGALPYATELAVLIGAGAATTFATALPMMNEYIGKKRTPAYIWSQLAKK